MLTHVTLIAYYFFDENKNRHSLRIANFDEDARGFDATIEQWFDDTIYFFMDVVA